MIKVYTLASVLMLSLCRCDTIGGSLESCATSYSGRLSGDRSGNVAAILSRNSKFNFFFAVDGEQFRDDENGTPEAERSADVAEDGTINGKIEGLIAGSVTSTIVGKIDFSDCHATGTWSETGRTSQWTIDVP